jgi:hypothetical protein
MTLEFILQAYCNVLGVIFKVNIVTYHANEEREEEKIKGKKPSRSLEFYQFEICPA